MTAFIACGNKRFRNRGDVGKKTPVLRLEHLSSIPEGMRGGTAATLERMAARVGQAPDKDARKEKIRNKKGRSIYEWPFLLQGYVLVRRAQALVTAFFRAFCSDGKP